MRNENTFTIETRTMAAPKLPVGRPPTKQEAWARFHFIYDGIKTHEALVQEVHTYWAWQYAAAVNQRGWDKHPDWTEGDHVIVAAVPTKPFTAGSDITAQVDRLWDIARERKAA